MTAKIEKQRLIAVLAEDHAERGTRPITARDFAVRAIEVLSDDGLSGQMARTTLSLGFGQDRALEVGRAIKFAERFRQ